MACWPQLHNCGCERASRVDAAVAEGALLKVCASLLPCFFGLDQLVAEGPSESQFELLRDLGAGKARDVHPQGNEPNRSHSK
jgi:hypothetical protein